MSEEVDRKSIEQYFIDYEKCWDDLKRFHKYMEMIAGNTKGVFKVTNLMEKLEREHKIKMIIE